MKHLKHWQSIYARCSVNRIGSVYSVFQCSFPRQVESFEQLCHWRHCVWTAVQQERGPRKNKGRRRLCVTSRRDDVTSGNLQPAGGSHSSCSPAVGRIGATGVSAGDTDRHCSAFTAVKRIVRNTFTEIVANSNSSSSSDVTSQSASALDMRRCQCKYCFIRLLAEQYQWTSQIFINIDLSSTIDAHCCHMGTAVKHPVPAVICNFWHPGTLTLSPERESARMSKITNDGLTRSGTGCFIAVSVWQQWASKGWAVTRHSR